MLNIYDWSPETVVFATLLFLMVTVLIAVSTLCIHAGLFHAIHVKTKEPDFGKLTVMYKCGRGAYSESGALFTESHSLLPDYDTIGVYYDDPEKKSSDNLRYIVGLVLSDDDEKEVKEEHVTLMENNGYKKAVFPKVKYAVTTEFPYNNTLSCVFSVFRVYPALREYVERRELCAHPFIELYSSSTKRILFVGPLEQQDSFYVPEVLEEPEVLSSPCEDDSCDDEDSARVDDTDDEERRVREDEDSVEGGDRWEKSASLVHDEGSGAEESDTNTASSFEEIDVASLPVDTPACPPSEAPASVEPNQPSQAPETVSQETQSSQAKESTPEKLVSGDECSTNQPPQASE